MTEPEERPSLKDLDARLKAARQRQAKATGAEGKRGQSAGASGMGLGFRLAIELVTGLLVGVGVGLLLDRWLDTTPLFLILFFLLGSAAGFLNVYRVATGQGYAVGYRKKSKDEDASDGGSDGEGTGTGA